LLANKLAHGEHLQHLNVQISSLLNYLLKNAVSTRGKLNPQSGQLKVRFRIGQVGKERNDRKGRNAECLTCVGKTYVHSQIVTKRCRIDP